jgi:hypothetical protein
MLPFFLPFVLVLINVSCIQRFKSEIMIVGCFQSTTGSYINLCKNENVDILIQNVLNSGEVGELRQIQCDE